MGKRSDFKRRERNFYPTPESAVVPLVPHLPKGRDSVSYVEPCAGEGHLIRALQVHAPEMTLRGAFDIHLTGSVLPADARTLVFHGYTELFITNPPWPERKGEPTVSIALNLSSQAPTWLLLSADFCHNRYFAKLAGRCVKIVSVGRVSWMENGTSGKDNCAWYLFDANHSGPTEFVGRTA